MIKERNISVTITLSYWVIAILFSSLVPSEMTWWNFGIWVVLPFGSGLIAGYRTGFRWGMLLPATWLLFWAGGSVIWPHMMKFGMFIVMNIFLYYFGYLPVNFIVRRRLIAKGG